MEIDRVLSSDEWNAALFDDRKRLFVECAHSLRGFVIRLLPQMHPSARSQLVQYLSAADYIAHETQNLEAFGILWRNCLGVIVREHTFAMENEQTHGVKRRSILGELAFRALHPKGDHAEVLDLIKDEDKS